MTPLIVDGSVAAKWSLNDETLLEQAAALLDRFNAREVELMVPDLFWAEIGNVLWKAIRKNRCSRDAARNSIAALKDLALITVPSTGLLERAFEIATEYKRTVYDSIYVALALEASGQLITADEKLANALAAHLPVKWLGAWA